MSTDRHKVDIENEIPRASSGKVILQTGGTTGKPKEVGHKPSLLNYLNPFIAFVHRLKVVEYQTFFVGTPIFHGYGIAVLLLSMPLGKKCVITSRFNAEKACYLIKKHQVEFISLVPVMLDRLLQCNVNDLKSIHCIAAGGAKLNTKLIEKTFHHLGNILYNLYGTSETGLNIIATPKDLKNSPGTLGRKIAGSKVIILNEYGNVVRPGVVGELVVRNNWSMNNKNSTWIKTGDMGYQNKNGFIFLCGRADEMIISGGENVFPSDVEQILIKHPGIVDVAVIGIEDEEFGERLKAFVTTKNLTEIEIMDWLITRVARYQMPKEIVVLSEIPYTAVGKPDKKKLKNELSSLTK